MLVGAVDLVDEAVPVANVLAHPSRYQVDPAAHIALNKRLRGTARVVVGVYHSHVRSPAVPSPRDLAEALYPEFVWLIVSLCEAEPDFRAYRIASGRGVRLQMIVEP